MDPTLHGTVAHVYTGIDVVGDLHLQRLDGQQSVFTAQIGSGHICTPLQIPPQGHLKLQTQTPSGVVPHHLCAECRARSIGQAISAVTGDQIDARQGLVFGINQLHAFAFEHLFLHQIIVPRLHRRAQSRFQCVGMGRSGHCGQILGSLPHGHIVASDGHDQGVEAVEAFALALFGFTQTGAKPRQRVLHLHHIDVGQSALA